MTKKTQKRGINDNGWIDAHFSLACYKDEKVKTPTGWSEAGHHSDKDGIYAQAYRNTKSHEIVIAVRGTVASISNYVTDGKLFLGKTPVKEISTVENFLEKVQRENKGYKIRLTGHSLGASIALYLNLKHGYSGHVFECPGIGNTSDFPLTHKGWKNQQGYNLLPNFVTANSKTPLKTSKLLPAQGVSTRINRLEAVGKFGFFNPIGSLPSAGLGLFAFAQFARHGMKNLLDSIYENYVPSSKLPQPMPKPHKSLPCKPKAPAPIWRMGGLIRPI